MYSEKTPDVGQRNCPKHIEFYSKNKFEKLMHTVGFIIEAGTKDNPSQCESFHEPTDVTFSS